MGVILREIREAREEARKDKEEMKGGIMKIRREIDEMKRERKRAEEKWDKEKEELIERIRKMEKRLMEKGKGYEGGKVEELEAIVERMEIGKRETEERDKNRVEERIKRMERVLEREEREKRKKSLVFKGIKSEKGDTEKEVRGICKEMGLEVEIEELRRIKTGKEERGEMIIIRVSSEEMRRRILENKG